MKIWLLSDLHLEYADLTRGLEIPDADVCVIAGDLCRGIANGIHWLARNVVHSMPCVYVAGNHEFYESCDYELGDTRIVCNPRGYGDENPMFDPMLLLEI